MAIVDYGAGNLLSVKRALEYWGCDVEITSSASDIKHANRIILPGVGAFPKAMQNLKRAGLTDTLAEVQLLEIPLLGICLGMQMLFEYSHEFEGSHGLGLLSGEVHPIPALDKEHRPLKLPHIGWQRLCWRETNSMNSVAQPKDYTSEDYFYFVHSFAASPASKEISLATVEYGGHQICAAVSCGSVMGVQFHPEKSGNSGLELLKKFAQD